MSLMFVKYQRLLDRLPLGARSMLLAIAMAIIFAVWYYGLWQKLHLRKVDAATKIEALEKTLPPSRQQLAELESTINNTQANLNTTVNENKKEPLSNDTAAKLVPPHKISKALIDVINAQHNLTLLSLENLPPKLVNIPPTSLSVYEHGVIIKFRGDYFATMNYLKAVEKLSWKVLWDSFDYKVTQYPTAEVTLQIHTISDRGDWIDV